MASLDGSRHDNGELINSNVRPPAERRETVPLSERAIHPTFEDIWKGCRANNENVVFYLDRFLRVLNSRRDLVAIPLRPQRCPLAVLKLSPLVEKRGGARVETPTPRMSGYERVTRGNDDLNVVRNK